MKALFYLVIKKFTGVIRSWFKKPLGAILTVLAVIFFLIFLVNLILHPVAINGFDNLWIGVAVSALLTMIFVISLVSKKKALVFQNDASFVLAGPFSRKQVLAYVLLNDIIQNIWITFGLVIYLVIFLGSSITSVQQLGWLALVTFIAGSLMILTTSYDYILEKANEHYYKYKFAVLIGLGLLFLVLVYVQIKGMPFSLNLISVIATTQSLFYFPFVGWILGAFYYAGLSQWAMAWMFILIMLVSTIVVTLLFFNNKVDFYEQAILDSERTQLLMNKAKEGNSEDVLLFNKKIKNKTGKFYPGAMALWSSYRLQMRKTGQFLKPSEMIFFLMYTVIAYASQDVNIYRMLIGMTVFFTINSDSLRYELKRPFAYLIPESSFKKFFVLMIPLVYRVVLLTSLGGIVSVVLFKLSILDGLLFVFSLWGISMMLISGTALTLRLLKGQKNPLVEQFLRIIVVLIVLMPSIIIAGIITLTVVPIESPSWLNMISLVLFIMNVFVALFIVKLSSSLLDGNDMFAS